jgi:hypothetical protein
VVAVARRVDLAVGAEREGIEPHVDRRDHGAGKPRGEELAELGVRRGVLARDHVGDERAATAGLSRGDHEGVGDVGMRGAPDRSLPARCGRR